MILTKENIEQIDLDALINESVKSGKFEELLLIVPTNRKIRNLLKELISIAPGNAVSNIYLDTLGTISTKLLLQKTAFKLLSETASFVLLKQSIEELQLKYFSGYKGEVPTGTVSRIIDVINEYKKQGITSELLRHEASSLDGLEKLKALDIANIYEKYRSLCNGMLTKDLGDIYYDLANTSREDFLICFRKCYPKVSLIVIDGFDEFSNLEIEILDLLSSLNGVKVYINFDYYLYNPSVFSHLDNAYSKLSGKGFQSIKDVSYTHLEDFRNVVREKLFNRNNLLKEYHYSDKVVRIEASSREKEIELIAKEIKNLIIEKKVEPHQVCVSFNLIEKYSPIIRDLFTKYDIPFNLSDRYRLNESTAVIAIINFLEILENDFYYKNIFRALNNGIFDLGDIDITGLMKVSKELKIVSGYKNWTSSITDAVEILKNEKGYNDWEALKKEKSLDKAMQDIKKLWQHLEPFSKKQNYKTFFKNLEHLLSALKFQFKLVENLNERSEINIKAYNEFIDTGYEIFSLFDSKNPSEEHSLSYYLEKIRAVALSTRYNIHEKSKYGVQVTTLNEIRGLKFDYLFISGLCDGDFPTKYNPEIFFSGNFIKGEQNHLNKDRYHFYQGLNLWRKGLYLTFPLMEDSKELVESSFLKDFCTLFEVTNKTSENFNEAFFSRDEILKSIGQIGDIELCKELFPLSSIFDWEALKYSLDVAKIRTQKTFDSIYSGNLIEPEADSLPVLSGSALEELKKLTLQQFSVTQLEKYAACPFQYFLSKVLKVEVIEVPSEEIESFEIGTLLHSILYEFYCEISNKGIMLGGCNDEDFKKAENILFSIADAKIVEKTFKSPLSFFEQERIMGFEGNRKNSVLFKFLEFERENTSGFIPKFFEVSFGKTFNGNNDEELSNNSSFKAGDLKFGGQIDRIEINEDEKVFYIVDYKLSGKKPSLDDLQNGLSLQLPFYLYAGSEILKTKYNDEFEPAGIFIYSLKFKSKDFGKIPVGTKSNKTYDFIDDDEKRELIAYNKELIKNCTEKMNIFVKNIGDGKFNLSKLKDRDVKVCQYCNFRPVCRIQEID